MHLFIISLLSSFILISFHYTLTTAISICIYISMYVFHTSSFSFFSFLAISYTTLHYYTTPYNILLLSLLRYKLSSTITLHTVTTPHSSFLPFKLPTGAPLRTQ
ncbi:hypothetical protein I7I48_05398 [Histoplasma ohiense]|nr:hypothetical protein I7I48_05398 [Histoplasma ohiense (nom. inval.)]